MSVLVEGDCLEMMTHIPDGLVDMVFADLPYGVTANKWDTVIPFEPLWAELLRVGKKNCAFVFTATQPFATALINSQPKLFRYDLIWDRLAEPTGFLNCNRQPLRRHEHIIIFYRCQTTYNPQKTSGSPYKVLPNKTITNSQNYGHFKPKRRVNEGWRFPCSLVFVLRNRKRDKRLHPTQKPVALLEWLIKTYSNEGDVILDPVMGSGTTGVACKNTGREFIGIEKDATYFATAQKRIEGEP